jgi:hypothetical protein
VGRTGLLGSPALSRRGSACSVRPEAEATWPGPLARWPARRAPGARSPCAWPARWRGWQRLTDGWKAAMSSVKAPPLSGGCARKGGWRRGSPEQRRVGGAVGRRGAVAVAGGGACTVVADDIVLVLHHGERERKVRWGPRMTERGAG